MPDKKQTGPIIEAVGPDTAPSVIAYRVGQLEKAVTIGFEKHNQKLDTLVNSFASIADVNIIRETVHEHSEEIKRLVSTDDRQQGSIDVTRRLSTIGLGILGIVVSAMAVYFGVHR